MENKGKKTRNIWEGYDFKTSKSTTPTKEDYTNFKNIFHKVFETKVGKIESLKLSVGNNRLHINITNATVATVIVVDANNFAISDRFNDVETVLPIEHFESYIEQIIVKKVLPKIMEFYKMNYIKAIPDALIDTKKVNLSKITADWFKEKFEEISEECGNSEEVENIIIEPNEDGIQINFTLDCGRYGCYRNNHININSKGYVKTRLAEIIEGGDIDGRIKHTLEKVIIE